MIADGTRHIEREKPRTRWRMLAALWFTAVCLTAALNAWVAESTRQILLTESGASYACRVFEYRDPPGVTSVCVTSTHLPAVGPTRYDRNARIPW